MNQTISIIILLAFGAVIVALAACAPRPLSDANTFLIQFVASDLLAVLGVILAITLPASGLLHLELNKIEEHFRARGLADTRRSVRSDTYALIVLFCAAVVLLVLKPLMAEKDWAQTLFNGAALLILLWNVLLLCSITRTVFAVPPMIDEEGHQHVPQHRPNEQ